MPGRLTVEDSLGRTIVLPWCDEEGEALESSSGACEGEGAAEGMALGSAASSEGVAEGAALGSAEGSALAVGSAEGSTGAAEGDGAAEGSWDASGVSEGAAVEGACSKAEGSAEASELVGTTGTSVLDSDADSASADCCAPVWIWNVPLRPTWSLPLMKRIWAASALASGVNENEPSALGTCAIVCHCPFTCTWIWTLAGSSGEVCCQ